MGIEKYKTRSNAAELRRHAEELIAGVYPPDEQSNRSKDEALRLVHELEVHQIELEMQNSELLRTQEELEISRNTYAELYDFAPVGYFTFDALGLIQKANHTGARMLGIERRLLAGKPFIDFIADAAERDIFSNHLALVMKQRVMLRCEIRLTGEDGTVIYGQLQSMWWSPRKIRTVVSLPQSLTARYANSWKNKLQNAHDKLELTVTERTRELTKRECAAQAGNRGTQEDRRVTT